ncbi:hypothetical protein D3C87_77300 [compost metagenome]
MKKSIELNIPMWEIDRNAGINDFANQIIEIRMDLSELEIDLVTINKDIAVYNKRIDIYLSNVFNKPNFKHSDHVIALKENKDIHIFKRKNVSKNNESTEGLKPTFVIKINQKRIIRIMEILNDYNELIDEFDDLLAEYEDTADIHTELWSDVKSALKNTKFLRIYDNNKKDQEIEEFDEEKHFLVIVPNNKNAWGFKYIRKEDENKFNEFMEAQSELLENEQR